MDEAEATPEQRNDSQKECMTWAFWPMPHAWFSQACSASPSPALPKPNDVNSPPYLRGDDLADVEHGEDVEAGARRRRRR